MAGCKLSNGAGVEILASAADTATTVGGWEGRDGKLLNVAHSSVSFGVASSARDFLTADR